MIQVASGRTEKKSTITYSNRRKRRMGGREDHEQKKSTGKG